MHCCLGWHLFRPIWLRQWPRLQGIRSGSREWTHTFFDFKTLAAVTGENLDTGTITGMIRESAAFIDGEKHLMHHFACEIRRVKHSADHSAR